MINKDFLIKSLFNLEEEFFIFIYQKIQMKLL